LVKDRSQSETKIRTALERIEVRDRSCRKVIDRPDVMAVRDEPVCEVRADEAGAASDQETHAISARWELRKRWYRAARPNSIFWSESIGRINFLSRHSTPRAPLRRSVPPGYSADSG